MEKKQIIRLNEEQLSIILSKTIKKILNEDVGFDADDELAEQYIAFFQSGRHTDTNPELNRADMWESLGEKYQNYVLKTSNFTGAIELNNDMLTIYHYISLKEATNVIGDAVDNIFYSGHPDANEDFYTLKYKFWSPVNVQDIDPEDHYSWELWINPKKKYENMVKTKDLEWILLPMRDEIWWRDKRCLHELKEYTGWSFYQNGVEVK